MKPVTNPHHLQLIKIFKENQTIQENNDWVKKYLGTSKKFYNLKAGVRIKAVKEYLKSQDFSFVDLEDLLISLSYSLSAEEIFTISQILTMYPKFRHQLDPRLLETLLARVEGWAETDTICQMCFTADDLLENWPAWKKALIQFTKDPNIHKRRASLVLLTKPTRQSDDSRLSDLAFAITDKLKGEKEILITKAVSWILRSLIKHHKQEVADYLITNENTLPRIAIREVKSKLLTGKKYVHKQQQKERE